MGKLILLRHGQSVWNKENRFTGWMDVGLSETGRQEAQAAGEKLKSQPIDYVFTSVLTRAIETARIALAAAGIQNVPVEQDEALNERHYGKLQGCKKNEAIAQYGAQQVHQWRRGYEEKPPDGESLKEAGRRVWAYYHKQILPPLTAGKNVLVVAHGNSLRALVKELAGLSHEEIAAVEIPTGAVFYYEMGPLGPISGRQFL